MKSQKEELKRRIAILVAEGEIEKAKVVDDLFQVSRSLKGSIQSELKPANTDNSIPAEKHAKLGSKRKLEHVGRNHPESTLDSKVRSWDPGPPHDRSSDENRASAQQFQQMLNQQTSAS